MTKLSFINIASLALAPFFLAGCSNDEVHQPAAEVAIDSYPLGEQGLQVDEPELRVAINDVAARIAAGDPFVVDFDSCAFDDEGYDGLADPLGLLKCGEQYNVKYNVISKKWSVKGLDEGGTALKGSRYIKDYTGPGSDPYNGRVTLWGTNFGVSAAFEIIRNQDEVIGHIEFD